MVRAAVLSAVGAQLQVRDIYLAEPGPQQVRVRIAAAGVCHSDLSIATGTLSQTLPAVLGHEGAGIVAAVGSEVTHVAPGDRVLLNWHPSCGECHFCGLGEPYLCLHGYDAGKVAHAALPDGTTLYPGLGTAAFAEETIVPAGAAILVPEDLNLQTAALLGCAALTGFGAVVNSANVQPGESVVVFGLGGVGLSVIQAARIAKAGQIIAVDVSPSKEELARDQGATDFLVAGQDTAKQVRALSGGYGADHAIECVGRADTIRAAWSSTRRGGRTTVVGIGNKKDLVSFSALEVFHFARTLTGCVYGSADPARDVPLLIEHVRAGRFRLDALVTDRIDLDGIPEAFERMTAGQGGRALVVF